MKDKQIKQVYIGAIDPNEPFRVKLREKGTKKWFWYEFRTKAEWKSFFKRWRDYRRGPIGFSPASNRFFFTEENFRA